MSEIITRFPPSPTGYLHIGGARTALFNWLFVKHFGGKLVLRIEDTDAERSTQESVDAIFDALDWLGIDWDDGPHYQSKRLDVYTEHVNKLIESGHAYYCTCTQERLEEMRNKAKAQNQNPMYDRQCRDKGLEKTDGAVVRFKSPLDGNSVIKDVIKGNIVINNTEIDDFIILRSDGSPMYNLACVIDDITMNISHVIRGDDHISNTPKQMMLFTALGVDLPVFGHVPMVLGPDKSRLSKRHGAMSVTEYREMGYTPDALINYLVRLGWSHGDQEFFTRDDLIEKFTLDNIGKSAGIFNPGKLLALNADHIKEASPKSLFPQVMPFMKEKGIDAEEGEHLENIIETLQPRSKTFIEMAEGAEFYYNDEVVFEEKPAKKFLKPNAIEPLTVLAEELKALTQFAESDIEDAFKRVMEKTELKLGKIAQPVRVALTGKAASPGIFEIIDILGRDSVVSRIEKAIKFINAKV